jgi:hypothetical protein
MDEELWRKSTAFFFYLFLCSLAPLLGEKFAEKD